MPVLQVEEYYLYLDFKKSLCDEAVNNIEGLIVDAGFSKYEFQENNSVLIVDDIPDEGEGESLEAEIRELLRLEHTNNNI